MAVDRVGTSRLSAKHIRVMSNETDELGRRNSTRYNINDVNDIAKYEVELKLAPANVCSKGTCPAPDHHSSTGHSRLRYPSA